ncbi:MAG: energy transducer TonB [Geothrix sp.]|nr:energy transducer TonB [Geothrix sp.]
MKILTMALLLCGSFLASQAPQPAYKLMPQDRWGNKPLGGPVRYPRLAAIAKISGDVITAVVINKEGKVEQVKSLSGPPQLRSTADSLASSIKFTIKPEDGEGPWLFFVTSEFKLNSHNVYCLATPKDKIPYDQLKKPSNSNPSSPAS